MQDPARISGLSLESMTMFLMKRCRYGPLGFPGNTIKAISSISFFPSVTLLSFASEKWFSLNWQLKGESHLLTDDGLGGGIPSTGGQVVQWKEPLVRRKKRLFRLLSTPDM